jgi:protein-disulfide isomerase
MATRGHIVELKAPAGKFRVVGVDLFSHEDYLGGDYASQAEAYKVADDHNTKRSGSMDDIYYVYDDQGTYIRGNEAVGQKIAP